MRLGDILKAGGWDDPDIPTAASIIGAESGFRPTVRNTTRGCGKRQDGSTAYAVGLGQVCTIHLDKGGLLEGWTEEDLQHPVANARAMRIIKDAQGWGAWEVYTSGAFRRFPRAERHDIPAPATGGQSLSDTAKGVLSATLGNIPGIGPFVRGWDVLGLDIPDVVPDIPNPGDALDNFQRLAQNLTDPATWFRVGKGWLGGVLIVLGTAGLVFVVAKSVVSSDAGKAATNVIPAGKATKVIGKVT